MFSFNSCHCSTNRSSLRKKFLISFSLAVLLGLSWTLGYLVLLTTGYTHLVFSIVFCLCTTTQVRLFYLPGWSKHEVELFWFTADLWGFVCFCVSGLSDIHPVHSQNAVLQSLRVPVHGIRDDHQDPAQRPNIQSDQELGYEERLRGLQRSETPDHLRHHNPAGTLKTAWWWIFLWTRITHVKLPDVLSE